MPKVSVIIPTVKGDETLKECLMAINYSSYKDLETIVVDEGLERSAQRNIGLSRAKGDYILILDSDQIVSYNLIKECVGLLDEGFGSVYIPEIITTEGFFGYLRNWERQFYTGTAIDVVRFVRKGCPKFNESMSGPEDSDWDRRVNGYRIVSHNVLYHYDNIGIIKYFKKKAYYSKSMKAFEKNNPNDKVLDWKWRCWVVFTEKGKWKRCLKRPDLFLLLMLVIFIRGIIYKCQS